MKLSKTFNIGILTLALASPQVVDAGMTYNGKEPKFNLTVSCSNDEGYAVAEKTNDVGMKPVHIRRASAFSAFVRTSTGEMRRVPDSTFCINIYKGMSDHFEQTGTPLPDIPPKDFEENFNQVITIIDLDSIKPKP